MHSEIEKFCVRVKSGGHTGSGVLLPGRTSFYVLTAAHCLGGQQPQAGDIVIEKQSDYTSPFNLIKCVGVVEYSQEHDFALIEVDFDDEDSLLYNYKLGRGAINDNAVKFCGYQGVNVDQFRPYIGRLLAVSEENRRFKITLQNDTFDQGGEEGSFLAKGLSGSGVFIYRHNSPFLIGILKSVVTDKAWNDDIECCSITHLQQYISEFVDLSDIENLKRWRETLDKEVPEREIEAFKEENNEFFEHLYRKNQVLHPDIEKANRITVKQIKKFLAMKDNIRELENNYPQLYARFKSIVKEFVDKVEDDYSANVDNSQAARNIKIQLEKNLKDEFDVLPDFTNMSLSEYQVIEWLGICTLDFTTND